MVKKFRRKPDYVEALQYTGENKREIIEFTGGMASTNTGYSHLTLPSKSGLYKVDVGDYVVKIIDKNIVKYTDWDRVYPCKPNRFLELFEEVE